MWRKQMIFVVMVMLVAACSLTSTSCFSLKYSTTSASIPPEAETVSVQFFENQARNQEANLNQRVTDALKDYIASNTNLLLINNAIGDVDFEGAITGYDIKPVAIVSGDQAAKTRFTITLKVKYTCEVNPDMNFESSFSRYEDFESTMDFETAKATYTEDILKLLIEDIFNKAFVNW
jgi:hypothetical protein